MKAMFFQKFLTLIFHFIFFQNIKTLNKMIDNYRDTKNQLMMNPATSPLTADQIKRFKGLNYFASDSKYTINARFTAEAGQSVVSLNTSSGGKIDLIKHGMASFNWQGKPQTLAVFRNKSLAEFVANSLQLFIPFSDLTSGNETFKGGRYLPVDAPIAGTNTMVLDFNKAMNNFNAYNDNHLGVSPPAANVLVITMDSGERKYEDR